jgi:beta-xylosidase
VTPLSAPTLNQASVAPTGSYPWVPDQGDGTYRNPVLYADYSDPDAIRHGDDFYLTASSFNCTPGLPILHSRDLVNWTIIGHALRHVPHPRYADVQPGCGVWAPSLRFHDGKFWIFFPTPDEGIYVITASHPAGPWSEPHLLQAGKGLIDPCPLWDDDGKAYLVHAYAASRSGRKHMLHVRPMAPDGSSLIGDGQIVFHAPERHPTLEGPKFLKKDGWYYILAPAGGVATGWQVALRSRNIYGPYEDKVVLEQGGAAVNGPHQGALVDAADGRWWFLHFQDAGIYGRIVHLQPVTWTDEWPLIGQDADGNGIGEPIAQGSTPVRLKEASVIPETSDEFDREVLGLQWQWQGNFRDDWYSTAARPGWMRLFTGKACDGNLQRVPNLLLQKLPARSFEVETLVEFSPQMDGDEAGLIVAGRTNGALFLRRVDGKCILFYRDPSTESALSSAPNHRVILKAVFSENGRVQFFHSSNGAEFTSVPANFTATAGVWIGAKIGIYCLSRGESTGHADFDYFRFSPLR